MAPETLRMAGVLLVLVPTVVFGGWSLLRFIYRRVPGYFDNELRRSFFRAGHAHAGVLIVLALVGLLYLERANLGEGARAVVRAGLGMAPILVPSGFFFSVAAPDADKPNAFIWLAPIGGLVLSVATVMLGIGLLF